MSEKCMQRTKNKRRKLGSGQWAGGNGCIEELVRRVNGLNGKRWRGKARDEREWMCRDV